MIIVKVLRPNGLDYAGIIPMFLSVVDPDTAAKQIDKNYQHGGGWSAYGAGKWAHKGDHAIKYPGDPVMKPYVEMEIRDEVVCVYDYGLVAIFQLDGTFEVSRCD